MAIEIIFKEENCDLNPTLETFPTNKNKLFIRIKYESDDSSEMRAINLNKNDAIKLAKEIRKAISFLED
jgi:ABC-type oligopeptide transport system substrate-binding subunit